MGFFGVLSFLIVCIFQICNVHARRFENETIGNENRLEKYEPRGGQNGQCLTKNQCHKKGGACHVNFKDIDSCTGILKDGCERNCKFCCLPNPVPPKPKGSACNVDTGMCKFMEGTCVQETASCSDKNYEVPYGCGSGDCKCCVTHRDDLIASVCFGDGIKCIYFSSSEKTWDEASSTCADKNGNLTKLDFLEDFYNYVTKYHQGKMFWTNGWNEHGESGSSLRSNRDSLGETFPWFSRKQDSGTNKKCWFVAGAWGYSQDDCNAKHHFICDIDFPRCFGSAVRFGAQCLTFFFHEDMLSWYAAKFACIARGARLAKLDHPLDVAYYVTGNYYEFGGSTTFWTGASSTNGEWVWTDTDGQSLDKDFPWGDFDKSGCMVIQDSDGYYADGCNYRHHYICEDV